MNNVTMVAEQFVQHGNKYWHDLKKDTNGTIEWDALKKLNILHIVPLLHQVKDYQLVVLPHPPVGAVALIKPKWIIIWEDDHTEDMVFGNTCYTTTSELLISDSVPGEHLLRQFSSTRVNKGSESSGTSCSATPSQPSTQRHSTKLKRGLT